MTLVYLVLRFAGARRFDGRQCRMRSMCLFIHVFYDFNKFLSEISTQPEALILNRMTIWSIGEKKMHDEKHQKWKTHVQNAKSLSVHLNVQVSSFLLRNWHQQAQQKKGTTSEEHHVRHGRMTVFTEGNWCPATFKNWMVFFLCLSVCVWMSSSFGDRASSIFLTYNWKPHISKEAYAFLHLYHTHH